MTVEQNFISTFRDLTQYAPTSWQIRLYKDCFANGVIPAAIDIPTGLGKTAVMALWLIARSQGANLPRRLVYVVDRRAVVDQATDFAISLRKNLDNQGQELKATLGLIGQSLPISTLRGQHIDNREWLEDPSIPAIIVGTVDMIGSRLLFEGYGVSRKMRPYHAGLLGADTLVVLDEAHLVPPFEKLLETIEANPKEFAARSDEDNNLIPQFRLLSLSATGRERMGSVFRLEDSDLDEPHLVVPVTRPRLNAKKSLEVKLADERGLAVELAREAWVLSGNGQQPVRCLVYCDKRETARTVQIELDKLAHVGQNKGKECQEIKIGLFVGARRIFERENAAKELQDMGFIAGSKVARTKPTFLVATSAGEVGVDLDADYMVCDLVNWERMVQRLGRVNRRGEGDAKIIVLVPNSPQPKNKDKPTPAELEKIALHVQQVDALCSPLTKLPSNGEGIYDASPGALRDLKIRANEDRKLQALLDQATSSPPLRPALTRALVDAWSMTSLKEHTGRPGIAPWLRGWVDDMPQTAVVWRKHLPVRTGNGASVKKQEIESFFEAAPLHASEMLETETWRVVDWLMDRTEALTGIMAGGWDSTNEKQDGMSIIVSGLPLQSVSTVAFVLTQGGELRQSWTLDELFDLKRRLDVSQSGVKKIIKDDLNRKLAGAALVVDTRLGGLNEHGMLDEGNAGTPQTADDGGDWLSSDDGTPVIRFKVRSLSTEEQTVSNKQWRERLRFAVEKTSEGEVTRWLVVEKWRSDAATEEDRSVGPDQTLKEHQEWAVKRSRELAERIGLPELYAEMLAVAARLHDEGKRAERWQRAFNADRDAIYAKTKGPLNVALLDGYRHEFGSLPFAEIDPEFKSLPEALQDLVLHLIAAHHGQARPIVFADGCEDAPPSVLETRAREVALRFARLQKRWGPWGLAWWEALLRAADQQASRDNEKRNNSTHKETP